MVFGGSYNILDRAELNWKYEKKIIFLQPFSWQKLWEWNAIAMKKKFVKSLSFGIDVEL